MIPAKHPSGKYILTEGFDTVDMAVVHAFFSSSEAYWTLEDTDAERLRAWTVSNSFALCDGQGAMIGGFRLITDRSFFGYLADVFVLPEYRGQHLAEWMVDLVLNSEDYKSVKRWSLRTRDAQGLYEKLGFKLPENQHWEMELRK